MTREPTSTHESIVSDKKTSGGTIHVYYRHTIHRLYVYICLGLMDRGSPNFSFSFTFCIITWTRFSGLNPIRRRPRNDGPRPTRKWFLCRERNEIFLHHKMIITCKI